MLGRRGRGKGERAFIEVILEEIFDPVDREDGVQERQREDAASGATSPLCFFGKDDSVGWGAFASHSTNHNPRIRIDAIQSVGLNPSNF
jgi:hypothetical protein